MPHQGALCFPGVNGNPLISLNVDFFPGVPPRFPGVLELIDFIELPLLEVCVPHTPYALRAPLRAGASALRAWCSPRHPRAISEKE